MSNSSANSGCLGIFALIAQVAAWIFSGMLSWNIVEPDGFGGAIVFLIVWSILGAIFHGIVYGLMMLLVGMFDS